MTRFGHDVVTADLFEALDTNLISGLRVSEIGTDEVVYEVDYREPMAKRRVA